MKGWWDDDAWEEDDDDDTYDGYVSDGGGEMDDDDDAVRGAGDEQRVSYLSGWVPHRPNGSRAPRNASTWKASKLS